MESRNNFHKILLFKWYNGILLNHISFRRTFFIHVSKYPLLIRDLYVSDITTSTLVSSDHLLATLTVDVEFTLAAGSKQQDGVQCDIKLLGNYFYYNN